MINSNAEMLLSPKVSTAKTSGFTLIEILIAIAIIAILTAIAYPVYTKSIDRAKITKGISTLETIRKVFEDYHINNADYPPALDIATGQDGTGRTVLTPALLSELNNNISSFESYIRAGDDYTLTARAIDSKHSLLVLKPGSVVLQGP